MSTPVVEADVREVAGAPLPLERLSGARVLVTGATGTVGQYLVRALLALGDRLPEPVRVVAAVRDPDRARALLGGTPGAGRLEVVRQDVREPFEVDGPLTWVVHAASPADPAVFRDDPVGVVLANVLGTRSGLDLAARTGAGLCLVSSLEVYGSAAPGADGTVPESTPGVLDSMDRRSAYPESKRLAETLCVAHHAQHGTPYRVARLSHTYGPAMPLDDARVQAYFLRQSLAGEDIVMQSDGTLRRTYTYLADATTALLALLVADEDGAYNIADDRAPVSMRELAEAFQRHSPRPGGAVVTAPRTDTGLWSRSAGGTFLDCSRLRATGWEPRVTLDAGVARTVAHHVQAGAAGPADPADPADRG